MRLFTAIDIPQEVRANLHSLIGRLKPLAKVNWSPVDNLHITTKFIGEWAEARLDEMKQSLAAVPSLLPATNGFEISIRGLGWFPNAQRPRVFWAGVNGGEPLLALAHATEQQLSALGIPPEERDYSPHLTLARIRESVPLGPVQDAIQKETAEFGTFRATEFFLYLSAGGKYTRLAEFPLH